MVVVLRFVNRDGFIREPFFYLDHVKGTCSLTIKNEICAILYRHTLDVENICGQGYSGASNMYGEWNGLQALFLKECPSAYYVHCLAHRLQLALVVASREVHSVHEFFNSLSFIINSVDASCKRHEELQVSQEAKIAHTLANNELKAGKGANQISSLKRAGDTRWGSHFNSICSLIAMFDSTCYVLENIRKDGSTYSQRGDASVASKLIQSFEFIFILHLMKEIMGITNILCQALQQKSQDILNAMHLVSSTKKLIQDLIENGWNSFLKDVLAVCVNHDLIVPDLATQYFEEQDKLNLRFQLKHFEYDMHNDVKLRNLSCLSQPCLILNETRKSKVYHFLDRLIRLVLTLSMSIATSERSFSAMKILKTRLRNKMEDEFLADNLVVNIKREIPETFTSDSILEDFVSLKERRS